MEKPVELKTLSEFVRAVINEFWDSRPAQYDVFRYFLGQKIDAVQRGDLKEEEYVAEWGRKLLELKGETT